MANILNPTVNLIVSKNKEKVKNNSGFAFQLKQYRHLILMIGALLLTQLAFSQDSTKTTPPKMVVVETNDGTTINGSVVNENDSELVLNTKSVGQVTFKKVNLKSIKIISNEDYVDGVYWFENPNATRYIIGPSAFNLKKGEGYYQNLYLFGQSVNVGITDHFSIGGGTEIASILGGEVPSIFFLTPKIGYEVAPKLNLGAGILYVHVSENLADYNINTGILYGVATFGSKNNNFTLGLGWGYHNNSQYEWYNVPPPNKRDAGFATLPTITFSGMTRLAKRFSLTTENWINPVKSDNYLNGTYVNPTYTYGTYFSYGMRFMGEKNSVDFGFINNADIASEIPIGLPYIDFVVKFGGNKKK